MKKIIIGALATITILVAGIFAYLPVQQANAVHTLAQAGTAGWITITPAAFDPATAPGTAQTLTCDAPFQLTDVAIINTTDPMGDNAIAITRDQDGAGGLFTPSIILIGAALGVSGTDTNLPVFVNADANGFVIATTTSTAAEVDVVTTAFNFKAPATATCSVT